MPRTSRFDVVFNALGTQWLAHFSHRHDSKGLPYEFRDRNDRPITTKVKHVTTCTLSNLLQNNPFTVEGEAFCSMKDQYDWKKGIKGALVRTLENMGYPSGHPNHGQMLNSFFKEVSNRETP